MQFVANQIISFCISGAFGLIWIGLLIFSHISDILPIVYEQNIKVIAEHNRLLIVFCVFVFIYPLGIAINSMANRLFKTEDKKIRKEIFEEKFPEYKDKPDIDAITACYHELRFKLYLKNQSAYEYLSFHRESIRILRATALNMLLISAALLTTMSDLIWWPVPYLMTGFIVLFIVLKKALFGEDSKKDSESGAEKKVNCQIKSEENDKSKAGLSTDIHNSSQKTDAESGINYNEPAELTGAAQNSGQQGDTKVKNDISKAVFFIWTLSGIYAGSIFVINLLMLDSQSGLKLECTLSITALLFSLLTYWAWRRKQAGFYKTIINFYKAC